METNSRRPLSVGPLEVLTYDLWMVQELVSRLPVGLGETSKRPSLMSHKEIMIGL